MVHRLNVYSCNVICKKNYFVCMNFIFVFMFKLFFRDKTGRVFQEHVRSLFTSHQAWNDKSDIKAQFS